MIEEEARAVLDRMRAPPVVIEGDAEDGEMVAKHIGLFEADNRQKADAPVLTEEEAQAAIVHSRPFPQS